MNPATVFLIVAAATQYQYDDYAFSLEENTSSFVLEDDSGWFPSYHDNSIVQNLGRSSIQAELWYGTEVQWLGIICEATIEPGERIILDNGDKLYYYTGLKILNNNAERAIFHAEGGYRSSPYTPGNHFDMFKYLSKTFRLAVKYIPSNSTNIFEGIVPAFWPEQLNVWNDILNQISPLFDTESTRVIEVSIQNNLVEYKSKFENLIIAKEPKGKTYMTIALELSNVEEKFLYDITTKINLSNLMKAYILPIYSNIISMKIHFYCLGVRYKDILGLSEQDVQSIRGYASKTFNNASNHILNVSEGMVDYAYQYSEAPNIFNNMMNIRSHLALHGFEYIPIWKDKLNNPTNNNEVFNPVVSYSTFYGKPTANLYAQSTPVTVPQPLNPMAGGEKKILLTNIVIYLTRDDPLRDICGAKVLFDNGREYVMGKATPFTEDFDLEGAQILQLSVFGAGKIEGLKFYLSNNEIKSVGWITSTYEDFKLPDHYISSFYMSNDDSDLKGQAANVAVSYQWYVKTSN